METAATSWVEAAIRGRWRTTKVETTAMAV
jgi:hypothetical protein